MEPIDVILSLLPSLDDKGINKILKVLKQKVDPCLLNGHKIKSLKMEPEKFWLPGKTILYCEKCNFREEIK